MNGDGWLLYDSLYLCHLMIVDLRHIKDFFAETSPLFEYVNKLADNFWPSYEPTENAFSSSLVPVMFADRFCKGLIDDSRKEKYLASEEVQETLKAFGLDAAKFWYLCLCIKDYVEGQTVDTYKWLPTHREEITALMEEMDKLKPEPLYCDAVNDAGEKYKILVGYKGEGKAELTLKVGGSKHPIKIRDLQTISIVNLALSEFLDARPKQNFSLLDSSTLDLEGKKTLKDIYRIYLFDHYLSWFVRPLKANKDAVSSIANQKVSFDKKLLISRMIFVLGISDDEYYYEEYNEDGKRLDYLKNNLKRYKDVRIPTQNNFYW